MKKRILYIIGSTSIILATIYLLRYKTGNDISHNIPSDAVAVVNINLRNLEHHLLVDFLKHPLEYFSKSSSKKSKAPSLRDFYKAIDIDKNLIFYTTENKYNTWFSESKMINDKDVIEAFLTANRFDKKVIVKDEKTTDVYIKNNLYCFINTVANKDMFQISYSIDNLRQIYESLPNNTSLAEEGFIYKHLLKMPNDIVFVSKNKSFITADFVDGAIDFKGFVKSNLFNEVKTNTNEGLIGFDVNINKNNSFYQSLTETINRDKFAKVTQLSFDSIQTYWNGDLHFRLRNFTKQIDTIKTYEYDDDFNKIEKIDVQEHIVPDFVLSIGTNRYIKPYLQAQNALKIIENDMIFVIFPLVKTNADITQGQFKLYTNKLIDNLANVSKLNLFIDVKSYQKQASSGIYSLSKFYKQIDKFKVNIDERNSFSGQIQINSHENAFVKLFSL